MAFEPRNSIAGIMTAHSQSWKSPLSKVTDNYFAAKDNKRKNELAQIEKEKQEAERAERARKQSERDWTRKKAAEYWGMDENELPPMDMDTFKDLVDIENTQDENSRKRIADELDRASGALDQYMKTGSKGKDWAQQRETIARKFPGLADDLPQEYDSGRIQQIIAESKAGRDILKSNRTHALDKQKHAETARHNKASEANAASKERSGGTRLFAARDGTQYTLAEIEKIYKRENNLPDALDILTMKTEAQGDPVRMAQLDAMMERAANPPSLAEWAQKVMGIRLLPEEMKEPEPSNVPAKPAKDYSKFW